LSLSDSEEDDDVEELRLGAFCEVFGDIRATLEGGDLDRLDPDDEDEDLFRCESSAFSAFTSCGPSLSDEEVEDDLAAADLGAAVSPDSGSTFTRPSFGNVDSGPAVLWAASAGDCSRFTDGDLSLSDESELEAGRSIFARFGDGWSLSAAR